MNPRWSLRNATEADRAFVENVYFETQRWIIERLFGWRGDEVERATFAATYHESETQIIVVDGVAAGWLSVLRTEDHIELDSIYVIPEKQGNGIGHEVIETLVREATAGQVPLTLSTAKINPARRLYERMGFVAVREDAYKIYMEHRFD